MAHGAIGRERAEPEVPRPSTYLSPGSGTAALVKGHVTNGSRPSGVTTSYTYIG